MKTYILIIITLLAFSCLAQEKKKDTLLIRYDKNLLNREQKIGQKDFLYRIKGTGNNGFVYFSELKTFKNLKLKNVQCFKQVIKNSKSYYKKEKIDDWKLSNYLGKYIIFLKKRKEYIQVQTWYEIE
jgi:hypothetical protein